MEAALRIKILVRMKGEVLPEIWKEVLVVPRVGELIQLDIFGLLERVKVLQVVHHVDHPAVSIYTEATDTAEWPERRKPRAAKPTRVEAKDNPFAEAMKHKPRTLDKSSFMGRYLKEKKGEKKS